MQLVDTQIGTATRSDGCYRIEGVPSDAYDVRVRSVGYQPIADTLAIERGAGPTRVPY